MRRTGKRILFDTGASDLFMQNAALLGIDLAACDLAVLSHGHYDHGGGLTQFLACNDHAPIYVNRRAFGVYYNGTQEYIGISSVLKENARILPVDDALSLDENMELCACNDLACPFAKDSAGLTELRGDAYCPDDFLHEQYLLIHEAGRRIVISGCSHKGVLNIVHWLKPDILIGGFHFMKQQINANGNAVLDRAAEVLLSSSTVYYTGHCTGLEQYAYLKDKMGDRLHALSAGSVMDI